MKDWEERLYALTEWCINEDRFDILNLYLKLSNKAADWIKNKKYGISAGDTFYVPRENGTKLKFTFYQGTTQLETVNNGLDNNYILISKTDSYKKEYSAIHQLEKELKSEKKGLGLPAPDNMYDLCADLNQGDTITFEGKNTYCCIKKDHRYLTLLKTFTGDIKNVSAKTFKHMEKVVIDYSKDSDRQDLFSQNRITSSGAIVTKVTSGSFAQEYINKLYSELQPGKTKKLKWGPINVLARRRRIGKGLVWYLDGEKTEEPVVKNIIGYFNNAPFETEFKRNNRNLKTNFDDLQCLETIKQMGAKTDFSSVYLMLCNYVANNHQSVSVDLKTFAPDNNGNYLAQGFAFQEIDGQVNVFALHYENNDFNNEVTNMKEIDIKEFVSFCNRVNEHNKTYLLDSVIKEIQQTYNTEELTANQIAVANRYVENKQSQNPLFTDKNVKKGTLEDLINGYANTSKEGSNHEPLEQSDFFINER